MASLLVKNGDGGNRTRGRFLPKLAPEIAPILDVLRHTRFRWATEDELQRGLTQALAESGFHVEREVRLNARDRIDLLVGRVGIEVKVDGPWRTVERQLDRYLECELLDAVVLVTAKTMHQRIAPRPRLWIHQLSRSGL